MVNEIGPYSGRRPWAWDGEPVKFVEVNADGNWSLTLFAIADFGNQHILAVEPGASYVGVGDDVIITGGTDGPYVMDFSCSDCRFEYLRPGIQRPPKQLDQRDR